MEIGYYRCPKDNPKTRKINAICYQYFGMDLICFGPEDVDIHRKKINGKVLRKGHWIEKTTTIPKIINNSPFKQKRNKSIYEFLEKNSYMMFKKIGNKETLYRLLEEDRTYRYLLIPTLKLRQFDDLITWINKYNLIIVKPVGGSQGRGIHSISKKSQKFIIDYNGEKEILNEAELEQFYIEYLANKNYLLQKYVQSTNSIGQPIDVRVQFEKNGKGKWVRAQSYVRIGNENQIVSNISKGGSIVRWLPFLKYTYGINASYYADKLKRITRDLPKKIEQLYRTEFTSLAFDFGLENGEFYLYEANVFPGGTFARGEIAMLRAAYTKYLLQTRLKKNVYTINEIRDLQNKTNKELDYYKKKYNKLDLEYKNVKQSISWKLTKPLRYVKKLITK